MPWPVYSERLLASGATNTWRYYVIPAGHRCVVKSIVGVNVAATAGRIDVSCAGYVVFIHSFPAAIAAINEPCMLVAYEGESIGVRCSSDNTAAQLHGYLFADTSGRSGPPASATQLPQPPDPGPPWPNLDEEGLPE